ncbi:tetratricopeptide repeat protein [Sorangium cellulosum]|uniref:tetratricopeptide repeat protein n=1 Tax=Sorangium cellulosum TaxID=56 RepID=UPI000A44C7A8|nr:tetratricopeptide repeat protein [Sorangium cellulosum]
MSAAHTNDPHDVLHRLLAQLASSTSRISATGEPPRGGEPALVTLNSSTAESGGIAVLGSIASSLVLAGGLSVNLLLGTTMPEPPHTDAVLITEETVKKFVSLLARQLATQETSAAHGNEQRRSVGRAPVPLVREVHLRALRLISICPVPLRPKDMATIFPDNDWSSICRDLIRNGWLKKRRGGLTVPIAVRKQLREDALEMSNAQEAWIATLEPLRAHCDTAIILSAMYVRKREWDKSVSVLSDVVDSLEPGPWNSLYLSVLTAMRHRKVISKLQSHSVVRLQNSIGLCLSRLRRWPEAIKYFLRLRRYSVRMQDNWGIGQSYINAGVVYYNMERHDLAESCYRTAVSHARETGDKWLLGRSLHNLGMTVLDRDVDAAVALIEESITEKASAGDFIGSVNAIVAQARIFATQEEYDKSIGLLRRAEIAAREFDLRHLRCNILWDLARVHADLGRHQEAWPLFSKARKLASKERFEYELEAITTGEAVASANAEDFSRAEKLFKELASLAEKHRTLERQISIYHDLGIVRLKSNNAAGARVALAKALELSLVSGDQDWIYRCRFAESLTVGIDGGAAAVIESIREFARSEEQESRNDSAGQLWFACGSMLIKQSASSSEIGSTIRSAERCFRRSNNRRLLIDLMKMKFVWRREAGRYRDALQIARQLERVAAGRAWVEERIRAIDEQGVCLQRLLKYREAEVQHRRALSLAEQVKIEECVKTTLNNLGLLFRSTGKIKMALRFFARAAGLENPDIDAASWVTLSINYALALYDAGNAQAAEGLLLDCETLARRACLWDELVRAVHTQANQAWRDGDAKRARRLYVKALRCAKSHSVITAVNDVVANYTSLIMEEISEAWEAGRTQVALAALRRGQSLCSEYKMPLRGVELFVHAGDCCWQRGEKHQFKALQMYVYAMNVAATVGLDEFVDVGARASRMVLHCDRSIRLHRIEQLEEQLRRWLKDGEEWNFDNDLVDFALWPLRVGRSLAVAFEKQGKLSTEAQVQIVQREMLASAKRATASKA